MNGNENLVFEGLTTGIGMVVAGFVKRVPVEVQTVSVDPGWVIVAITALTMIRPVWGKFTKRVRMYLLPMRDEKRIVALRIAANDHILRETRICTRVTPINEHCSGLLSHAAQDVQDLYQTWRTTGRRVDRRRLRAAVFADQRMLATMSRPT